MIPPWRQRVADFDAWADAQLERVRGCPSADVVFSTASHVGDFSVIWLIVAAARGLTSKERADQAIATAGLLAMESLLVNQGVKRLFRRTRPTTSGDERFPMRTPSTSSFPSGHASAAFFAATVLSGWGRRRWVPAWFLGAAIVGVSRAYVRIHHASDVVGGAVVGLALGAATKRALGDRLRPRR